MNENPLLFKEIEEYLNKGIKQREIAKLTKVSLVTVNKYCKRIRAAAKQSIKDDRKRKQEIKHRIELVKELRIGADEPVSEEKIKENTMRVFNALLVEIRARIPTMTNAELNQTTIDIWEKIK